MTAPRQPIPRVAIVHDALMNTGGAERTLTFMCEAFPDAPVFTSAYLPEATYPMFRGRTVHTLPGAAWARTERRIKQFLPVWLLGFRRLDLSAFDVVLTSTTFAAKHVRPPRGVRHACYCYAPFRWLWKPEAYNRTSLPFKPPVLQLVSALRPWLRRFDRGVMQRPERLATSCRAMVEAIQVCYRREARIIHPPIRWADYHAGPGKGDYYLSVSRLISHKRIDLAVLACRQVGARLVVVGDGAENARLRAMADANIQFAGNVSDQELRRLYAGCRALIFPSHEDYGLVPLETQASGRPVIAYGAGGVLETVREDETGIFFPSQTVEAVVAALQAFEKRSFDPKGIRESVRRFDVGQFRADVRDFVLGPDVR